MVTSPSPGSGAIGTMGPGTSATASMYVSAPAAAALPRSLSSGRSMESIMSGHELLSPQKLGGQMSRHVHPPCPPLAFIMSAEFPRTNAGHLSCCDPFQWAVHVCKRACASVKGEARLFTVLGQRGLQTRVRLPKQATR